MRFARGLCLALLCLSAAEGATWVALVPDVILRATFVWLNVAALGMFLIGVVSAANGLPTPSIAQVLHDVETAPRFP